MPHFVVAHALHRVGQGGHRDRRRSTPTPCTYQLSQRAEFFEEIVGLETTLKRPIVNTRDEPHADPKRFRRLHVIVGDANLSEIATFLKVGTTAIVLVHGRGRRRPEPRPVAGRPGAGPAPGLGRPLAGPPARPDRRHHGHGARNAVGALRRRPQVRRRARAGGLGDDGGDDAVGAWSWSTGRPCSTASNPTRPRLADTLDWVAKRQLLLAYQDRHSCGWERPPAGRTGLAVPRPARRQVDLPGAWTCAAGDAGPGGRRRSPSRPEGTRAWFRGKCLAKLARGRRHGQLGFPRLRHRDRPAAARPYDGPLEGNSRTHRRRCWPRAPDRRTCWSGSTHRRT